MKNEPHDHGIMVHAHMLVLRRWHLHPLNGLPDPKGSLSSRRPSAAIAETNCLVSETRKEETEKKRGQALQQIFCDCTNSCTQVFHSL